MTEASALVRDANQALETGDVTTAAKRLVEAADLHARAGDAEGQSRLLTQATVLLRAGGQFERAARTAQAAWDAAATATPAGRRAAAVEMAEIARIRGDRDAAVDWLRRATDERPEDEDFVARARILLKLASIEAGGGAFAAAAGAAGEAALALERAGRPDDATRVHLEVAGAWLEGGNPAQARRVVQGVIEAATERGDHALVAEAQLVVMAIALGEGDITGAKTAAAAARREALESGAALPYLTAASSLAGFAESSGDRVAAYESLAVAWVTLGDLIGRESARAMVEPLLIEVRDRWGPDDFAAVKASYEARRRAQLGR